MFRFEADLKVFVHREPIDFRAGINSQALLGHVEPSTTQIYTHVAIGKLKAVHALTHPSRLAPASADEGVVLLLAGLEDEAREEYEKGDSVKGDLHG